MFETTNTQGGTSRSVRTYGLPAILTVVETAQFLGLNVKTVYASINDGSIPGRKAGSRTIVFREALLDWLRSKAREKSHKRRT